MLESKHISYTLITIVAFGICIQTNAAMEPATEDLFDDQTAIGTTTPQRPHLSIMIPADEEVAAVPCLLTSRLQSVRTNLSPSNHVELAQLCMQTDITRWLDSDHTTVLMLAVKKRSLVTVRAILQSMQKPKEAALFIAQTATIHGETALSLAVSLAVENDENMELLTELLRYPIPQQLRQLARTKACQFCCGDLPDNVLALLVPEAIADESKDES